MSIQILHQRFLEYSKYIKGYTPKNIQRSPKLSSRRSLERYSDIRKKAYKTCPEFFTSYTYNQGITDSGLKRLIVKINKASGIKLASHKLRHTFATLMLEGGCDIYSLSKLMGHNNISTTTIYLNASAQLLREQISKHPLTN